MKPKIVISGVNLTMMGLRSVMQDCLASLAGDWAKPYDVIALVHKAELFHAPHVKFIEFPDSKSSWVRRLQYEFFRFRNLSERLDPYLWLSMHDITPDVKAARRAVYCHNPCPFYPFQLRDALDDWKFGAFTLFYDRLYGLNIRKNDFVIVQQDWMRREFRRRYAIDNVVVAQPGTTSAASASSVARSPRPYTLFYPSYPRVFKNFETILCAARKLESEGIGDFELRVTLNGTENRYARCIRNEFDSLRSVRFLGTLTREQVYEEYARADCLVFPSRLETWGMPISEFKATGKPMLCADLPYAHETVGDYEFAAFAAADDPDAYASAIRRVLDGERIWRSHRCPVIPQPFCRNWQELFELLLGGSSPGEHEQPQVQEGASV